MDDVHLLPESRKILAFKTSIRFKKDVKKLEQMLNQFIGNKRWNIDLDDIDKVLRIETETLTTQDIVHVINQAGYFCEELPD